MNWCLGLLSVCVLALSVSAMDTAPQKPQPEALQPTTPASANPAPEGKEQKWFSYEKLLKEVKLILSGSNQVKVKDELQKLNQALAGHLCGIFAVVKLKRAPQANKENHVLWLESDIGMDVMLVIDLAEESVFDKIGEWDFISAVGRLEKIQNEVVFHLVTLNKVLPFEDPLPVDAMVAYNNVLQQLDRIKTDKRNFDSKGMVELLSSKYHNKLGYIVGKVRSVEDPPKGELLLKLTVEGRETEVVFIDGFRNQLKQVEKGNTVSVAVRCSELPYHDAPKFFRGCFIELPESKPEENPPPATEARDHGPEDQDPAPH